jgi:hypothetical protein
MGKPYRVKLLRRVRLLGRIRPPGAVVSIRQAEGGLRLAAGLVSTKQAKPFDDFTRREVELFRLLKACPA